MIAGEYAAVWRKSPVLAVAVGEIAHARLIEDDQSLVRLEAFGQTWTWPRERVPTEGMAGFVREAMEAARHVRGGELPAGRLEVSVQASLSGHKLGLGSSAACTVAVMRALSDTPLDEATTAVFARRADEAHTKAQGGLGSGYDIHTIAHGGCCGYDPHERRAYAKEWPEGLYGAALFSGQSASTTSSLKGGVERSTVHLEVIEQAATGLLAAWDEGGVDTILRSIERCEEAFQSLATEHPWMYPPALRHLAASIRESGAVPRTSGAGGGDCMLAFTDDESALERLIAGHRKVVVARLPRDLDKRAAHES